MTSWICGVGWAFAIRYCYLFSIVNLWYAALRLVCHYLRPSFATFNIISWMYWFVVRGFVVLCQLLRVDRGDWTLLLVMVLACWDWACWYTGRGWVWRLYAKWWECRRAWRRVRADYRRGWISGGCADDTCCACPTIIIDVALLLRLIVFAYRWLITGVLMLHHHRGCCH